MTVKTDKRVLMFGGKGGVGKTTCAAATALYYAHEGRRTLLISTDPTPSLVDIFELERSPGHSGPLRIIDGKLSIWELGPREIAELWERKFGREVYAVFSSFVAIDYEEFVEFITTVLPGLGEEFMVDYIRELSRSPSYDKLIWDTAPLGQTLELLRMPTLLRRHLRAAPRVYSRLKVDVETRRSVLEILRSWEELSAEDMRFLRERVEFVMVTIPEALAVQQLARVFSEFARYGLSFSRLIVNNVVQQTDVRAGPDSSFLGQRARQQQEYLQLLHRDYNFLKISEVPLFPGEIKGLHGLAEICRALFPKA